MRIFKIGVTEIEDNETTALLTPKEWAARLEPSFPELKNATLKETQRGEDTIIEASAAPGRKG